MNLRRLAGVSEAGACSRNPERRRGTGCSSELLLEVVEAAGVEPASENVTGKENYMLIPFLPWALPQDVRGACSERTRNRNR